jgi:hypothetical protein
VFVPSEGVLAKRGSDRRNESGVCTASEGTREIRGCPLLRRACSLDWSEPTSRVRADEPGPSPESRPSARLTVTSEHSERGGAREIRARGGVLASAASEGLSARPHRQTSEDWYERGEGPFWWQCAPLALYRGHSLQRKVTLLSGPSWVAKGELGLRARELLGSTFAGRRHAMQSTLGRDEGSRRLAPPYLEGGTAPIIYHSHMRARRPGPSESSLRLSSV